MKGIWVFNGQQAKKYLLFIIAALFTAGVLFIERDALTIFSEEEALLAQTDEEPQAIHSVETDAKKLALTFDISWGQERMGPILDVLQEKGAQATFFLSSPWAENHPDIVQDIQEAGFEIGSHGHKHENYTRYEDDELREQITKADRILTSLTEEKPELLRPPNGDFDGRLLRIADELGYTVIKWDTNSQDWLNPGTERIVDNVVSNAHPGDIILLHASDSSKQTHEALPHIIDQLHQQGYELITVSDLITGAETRVREMD